MGSTLTKRGVLCKLGSIYDPLGLVSPVTLVGKCLYREVCCEKLAWDATLTAEIEVAEMGTKFIQTDNDKSRSC